MVGKFLFDIILLRQQIAAAFRAVDDNNILFNILPTVFDAKKRLERVGYQEGVSKVGKVEALTVSLK